MNRLLILLFLVASAVVLGLGWRVRALSHRADAGPSAVTTPAEPDARTRAGAAVAPLAEPQDARPDPAHGPAPEQAGEAAGNRTAAVDPVAGRRTAELGAAQLEGDWTLTGRAVCASGAVPQAELELALVTARSAPGFGALEGGANETRGRSDAPRRASRPSAESDLAPRATLSDAEGRFEFAIPRRDLEALGAMRFALRAQGPDGLSASARGDVQARGASADLGDLWLSSGGALTVEVDAPSSERLPSGRWLAIVRDAALDLGSANEGRVLATANVHPSEPTTFQLPVGLVTVELVDGKRHRLAFAQVQVLADERRTVRLPVGDFDPERRLWVHLTPPYAAHRLAPDAIRLRGAGLPERVPDWVAGDHAAFDDLPNARYTVAVEGFGCEPRSAEGHPGGPPVVVPVVGTAGLQLRVVDRESGAPIDDVVATLFVSVPGGSGRSIETPLALERDASDPPFHRARGLLAGDYELRIEAPGCVPTTIELVGLGEDEQRVLDVALPRD